MALIDKETIRKEIERRTYNAHEMPDSRPDKQFYEGKDVAYGEILAFLDSLPEQPVEGLEEEISRTYHNGSVTDTDDIDHTAYENIARHFYELGLKARKV